MFILQVNFENGFFDRRVIMYDEINKRVRTIDFVEFNSTREFYDILEIFGEVMLRYLINKPLFD